jgi:menaquinone-dependent protoporphyrinogen oxidase
LNKKKGKWALMTNKNVLIAYGSRYGSTEEISQEIAKVLENIGIDTQLIDLKKTKSKEWPSLESFDGVLIGSGIKIGKWMKEPRKFLEKIKDGVKKNEKILGVFVSSGNASIPEKYQEAKTDYLEKVIADIGIEADIYDAFGAVYDLSESSRMGSLTKKMIKMGIKEMSEETGIELDENARNDLRNWDQIQDFVEKFAELVLR